MRPHDFCGKSLFAQTSSDIYTFIAHVTCGNIFYVWMELIPNDIIASLNNPQIHAGACSFMLEQTLFMLCLMAESLGRQMYRKHNFSRLGVGTTFGTWERNLKPVEDVC